ncbi:MAG: ABC transporter ATP-binding protein [Candidatus Omnitrophica bacterium]|nr:ABC transporter ATP-binding protein [Candidatus Omnitrophota bacterium]
MGILEIKNLSLSLSGNDILHNISLEFTEGHIHAIIGPNGAGKSTLAFTVMGLEGYKNFEGDILLDGRSIKNMPVDGRAKAGITLGWQEPARYEGLSVKEFMRASAKDKSDKAIKEALIKVALDPAVYLKRAVDKTLSGGERKKVELASILVMMPRVVMLDEPDSGIDVASLKNIFETIRLLKKGGSTVILITHSLTVLDEAEDAFLICHGRLVEKGSGRKMRHYFKGRCLPCNHQNEPGETEGE